MTDAPKRLHVDTVALGKNASGMVYVDQRGFQPLRRTTYVLGDIADGYRKALEKAATLFRKPPDNALGADYVNAVHQQVKEALAKGDDA